MKALIIGATGATGKDLVNVLLSDPDYTEVVAFVRRTSGLTHPKLVEIVTDYDKLEEVSGSINGDIWFSCLGTTLQTAGSTEAQYKIDYELPARFAAIAKRNGVSRLVIISTYGASSASRVFYTRMKGQLEEHLASLAFDQYIIFRPGLLLRKNTDRLAEKLSAGALKFFNSLGLLHKLRPLPTSILAEKMAKAPKVFDDGLHFVELPKIFEL